MQRGIGHGGSRQANRANHRLWRQNAGPSHLDHNVFHHSGLDFRRVFISRRPSGKLCCGAQIFPLCQIIQLDDCSVNVTDQLSPIFIDCLHLTVNLLDRGKLLIGNHFETQPLQIFQGLTVAGKGHALRQLNIEHIDIQPPLSCDFRIQLAQGPGSGIPGIGKQRLAQSFLVGIQFFKAFLWHEHLPPDDQAVGRSLQSHGNRADCF